jgi:hypothetical protein
MRSAPHLTAKAQRRREVFDFFAPWRPYGLIRIVRLALRTQSPSASVTW